MCKWVFIMCLCLTSNKLARRLNAFMMLEFVLLFFFFQLVRFYKRIGFKVVHEVTGSTIGDLAHLLVWGGVGTRMDANVEDLLIKWCTRFKSQN